MRRIVHISGYSLAHEPSFSNVTPLEGITLPASFGDWEYVMFGDFERKKMGRVPMALHVAELQKAQDIVWSTGASWLPDGRCESQVMFDETAIRFREIDLVFGKRFGARHWFRDEDHFRRRMERTSIIDTESGTTLTSVQWMADYIRKELSDEPIQLTFVTSGNHAPRVARDATMVFEEFPNPNVLIQVVSSDTNYGGKEASDVIVRDLGT